MKTYPECLACLLKQTVQTVKLVKAEKNLKSEIIRKIEKEFLPAVNLNWNPPKISRNMHKLIKELLKNDDPYKKIKTKYNKIALGMQDDLKRIIKNSKDKLLTAIKVAIAGNVIDFGAQLKFDIKGDLQDILKKDFAIFHYDEFKQKLKKEKNILFLGDNTGEIVFDKIFIEFIKENYGSKIVYVVKEKPILNDATKKDAIFCGLEKLAEIISSGADSPGTVLDYCNKEFLKIFNESKFIISKGQGNFEALENVKNPIFFLFRIKCDVVADFMNLPIGSIILKYNKIV